MSWRLDRQALWDDLWRVYGQQQVSQLFTVSQHLQKILLQVSMLEIYVSVFYVIMFALILWLLFKSVYKYKYNSWNLNCRCPKNTYGEVCENSPNICRDLRPCLNSATCTAGVNALSKCTCPNDGKNFMDDASYLNQASNQSTENIDLNFFLLRWP